jgi:hypothetical protein
MRKCMKCGEEKEDGQFYSRGGNRKDKKCSYCKNCANKDSTIRTTKKRKDNKINGIKLKGGECKICKLKYNDDPSIFHFHHLDPLIKEKDFNNITSFDSFIKEIDKCILICGNCHFEIHGGIHHEYLLNKSQRDSDKITKLTIKRREQKLKSIEYLGGKCLHCGYNKCYGSLNFHHLIEAEKELKIGSYSSVFKWGVLQKELDKCILLCSNCHTRLHNKKD